MMTYVTQVGGVAFGLMLAAGFITADRIVNPEPPIQPLRIELREDGSAYYDRFVRGSDSVEALWSVTVLDFRGNELCAGSGRADYEPGSPKRDPQDWTVAEFVGAECEGIRAGMEYYVIWVPTDPRLPNSHWPAPGGGVAKVLPAQDGM